MHRLVNGSPDACIPADDRGLLYGDGLFETMRVDAGCAQLWRYHLQRLSHGCRALGLDLPQEQTLLDEIALVAGQATCVVRLLLTRGSGGRGYTPPATPACNRVVQAFPLPQYSQQELKTGLTIGFSELRLAAQKKLAGLKHLGRLEQVLARAQLLENGLPDALMLDQYGRVVESTQANVFLRSEQRWYTPRLTEQGVAGVFRAFLLDHMAVSCVDVFSGSLHRYESMFLCNSVRGIVPVKELPGVGTFNVEACLELRSSISDSLARDQPGRQEDL